MFNERDLNAWLSAAKEAARLGAAVLEHWRTRFEVREKGRCDLVTQADIESQQAIRQHFHIKFPDHAFLGEEDAIGARPGKDAPPTWIVDPLDGTTNYIHGCPWYCVSIGLQVAGELVVGVVYDPGRDEMFAGAKGQGAWVNDQRLAVSSTDKLLEALLAVGFPPDLRQQEIALDWWRHFSLRCRSLRRTGSTALNLAYVAAGRLDGYFGFDNHAWDLAGGAVLVTEAGGTMSNLDGSTFEPFGRHTLASNERLHAILVEQFRNGPVR